MKIGLPWLERGAVPVRAWLANLPLRTKLLAAFLPSVCCLLLVEGMGLRFAVEDKQAHVLVTHTDQVMELGQQTLTALVDMETAVRGYLLTGQDEFLEPYYQGSANYPVLLTQLLDITTTASQRDRWHELQALAANWRVTIAEPEIALRRQVNVGAASPEEASSVVAAAEGKRQTDAMRQVLNDALASERGLLDERSRVAQAGTQRLLVSITGGLAISLVTSLLGALLIGGDLGAAVRQLAGAARARAAGEVGVTFGQPRKDEIGQAAAALNDMARAWHETREHEAARLTERAVQVEKTLESERTALLETEADRQRLQQIVDVVPFGIAVVQDGRYVLQNVAATAMVGVNMIGAAVPAAERLGVTIERLDPRSSVLLPIERSLAGEVVVGEQFRVVMSEAAEPRTLLCSSVPLWDAEEHISGAVVVFEDISALKEAEKRRGALLAKMTHDVKNPLAAIKLLCASREQRVLGKPLDREQLADDFRRLQSAASRAVMILNNVMQATRQELGLSLRLAKERCDLNELVTRVVDQYRPTSEIHHICVDLPDVPVVGTWDKDGLTSVIENLVSNSIKYSPAGGDIKVRLGREDGPEAEAWARLSVQDTGTGISDADLPHIFEPFYRAERTVDDAEGSGVGLYAVREMVDAHGGSVGVQSKLGQGSLFTVRLPLAEPAPRVTDPSAPGTAPGRA